MKYTQATVEDTMELFSNVRPSDVLEMERAGLDRNSIPVSVQSSDIAVAARDDKTGALFGIGGLCSVGSPEGTTCIWWLGTHEVDQKPIAFTKMAHELLPALMGSASVRVFYNAIPTDFMPYIQFAERHLSATFDGEVMTTNGVKFSTFHIIKGEAHV